MALQIRKATRRKAKLRLALLGPTGSGKTMSALKLAFGIGGKVGVIDTENGSADLYAHLGDYDVITLEKPYTVAKYREAISAFEREGYTTIIVDSLTHAWAGDGGLLDKHGKLTDQSSSKNGFEAWRKVTPDHNALVEAMLSSPCHIIGTMRVKTEYVMEENDRGKKVPRKVGLQPVQRDGMEYEFTVVMDVDTEHKASASKDRTQLFDGWYDRISEDTGRKLLAWLESGEDAPKPVDKIKAGADAILERIHAAHDPEAMAAVLSDTETQRTWLADKRPDLHKPIADAVAEKLRALDMNTTKEAA
jgi:energy-coupling factor transporter ATP-binding protein EcfA2